MASASVLRTVQFGYLSVGTAEVEDASGRTPLQHLRGQLGSLGPVNPDGSPAAGVRGREFHDGNDSRLPSGSPYRNHDWLT
jgi:hypothetical protein